MKKGTVEFSGYPICSVHGAMNQVSKHNLWRCLMCHIGYDANRRLFLKSSSEGFRKEKPHGV